MDKTNLCHTSLTVRTWTEKGLLEKIRTKYPETKRMTYTGLNDFALRKLLEYEKAAKGTACIEEAKH